MSVINKFFGYAFGTPSGGSSNPIFYGTGFTATGAGGMNPGAGGDAPVNQIVGANLNWSLGGGPASGTHGNNTATVAGSLYWTQVFIDCNQTLTGVSVLIGGTGGTDKFVAALYDYQGNKLATTALAGVTVGTANSLQNIPFTATYNAVGPAYYFIALQSNGTTAKFQSYTVPGSAFITGSTTGTFGTLPANLTVGSTYNNNVGPVSGIY